jgi:hypothetical protein
MVAPLITSLDLPRLDPEDASEAAVDASGLVRGYTGWHIAPTITETLLMQGQGGAYLSLPTLFVTAVSAVTIDGVAATMPGDVTWGANGRLYWGGALWPTSFGSVTVTFTHGYAVVPADVRAVTKAVARRMVANPSLARQEAVAGYSATYDGVLLGEERYRLARYRLPGRP